MALYNKPQSPKEYQDNFSAKKPLMDNTQAHNESARCLFCYDAPCIQSCPTGIDIPLFIRQIHNGEEDLAAKTIYDSNWMGNACAKVCPTQVLCEGACVYTNQDQPAVDIGRLQNFATQSVIDSDKALWQAGDSNGKKVAIIGAGPAGIACACELRVLGYEVQIFESKSKATGLTVYGTAPYKITNEEALDEFAYLQRQLGFQVHFEQSISNKDDFKKLENEFDAIFIGVGLGETRNLRLEGEEHPNCEGAVEFVEELRMQQNEKVVGKSVVVIGGGNTAMDAASEAARMGAEKVYLVYRRSQEKMGGYYFEYELVQKANVVSVFNASPEKIIIENDKIVGLQCSITQATDSGLKNIDNSEFTIDCDMILKATGQNKRKEWLEQIEGMQLTDWGTIIADEKTFQIANSKYFAGGDVINGGKEVVNAAADGKAAAHGIHQMIFA